MFVRLCLLLSLLIFSAPAQTGVSVSSMAGFEQLVTGLMS